MDAAWPDAAIELTPGRSRRRPMLAAAIAVAAVACLMLALAWSAGLAAASLFALFGLLWALRVWLQRTGSSMPRQFSLTGGLCRVERAGAWETATSWTLERAGASCMRLHLSGVPGVSAVPVWRDAVSSSIWRSLCLLAVREREHPGSLRRPGGTA